MLHTLLFYLFAGVLTVSALCVVAARNPVHAVLFLILSFFNAAGLFVLMGAEFLAMLLVIVYVGAVAVLFLFVVMMLDVDFAALKQGFSRHLPIGIGVSAIFLLELTYFEVVTHLGNLRVPMTQPVENTRVLGQVLYTDYMYPFQVSGLILLVAMIGAIVLTLRHKPDAKRQDWSKQLARTRAQTIKLVKPASGSGIE